MWLIFNNFLENKSCLIVYVIIILRENTGNLDNSFKLAYCNFGFAHLPFLPPTFSFLSFQIESAKIKPATTVSIFRVNFNPIFTKIHANLKTTAVLSVPVIPGWSFALKIKNNCHIGDRSPGLDSGPIHTSKSKWKTDYNCVIGHWKPKTFVPQLFKYWH